tara:strand:+ start:9392 stop:10495 length:1104 start_codon:yes stop_codon:yes gene_type:complete
MNNRLLESYRVLDLAGYIAGAYCSGLLADLGADVIKVESFDGDGFRALAGFETWNRSKRGIAVNLQHQEGKDIIYEIAKISDCVVQNYRYGVAEKLNVDYQSILKHNPTVTYCTINAYGTTGPYNKTPGFDPLFQAMSGSMVYQSENEDKPAFMRVALSDYTAALLGAWSVCLGLLDRSKTGNPHNVETCLMNTIMAVQAAEFFFIDNKPWELESTHDNLGINEYKHLYQCNDSWIYIDAKNQENFNAIKASINSPSTQDFIAHLSNTESSKIIELIRSYDGYCEKVSTTKQLMESQFLDNHSMQISVNSPTYGEIKQSVHPAIINNEHLSTTKAAPKLGEDTDNILQELGYLKSDIDKLRIGRVIL